MMNSREEKFEIHGETIYKYSSSWIYRLESEEHWRLYWMQQKIMQNYIRQGQHVLEIGVGSGFTANYLRSKGVEVTTLDIDPEKRPDIVANIVDYNFSVTYDHILAFEVFEHIPYEDFKAVLRRLYNACSEYLFLSVPRNEKVWFRCVCKIWRFKQLKVELSRKAHYISENHHFWELDYGIVTLDYFEQTLENSGFRPVYREKVFSRVFFSCRAVDEY